MKLIITYSTYLIDNNYIGVVNDISGNNIEYTLDDLLLIWDNLYNYKKNF